MEMLNTTNWEPHFQARSYSVLSCSSATHRRDPSSEWVVKLSDGNKWDSATSDVIFFLRTGNNVAQGLFFIRERFAVHEVVENSGHEVASVL